jgi:hypothetical protein
LRTSNASISVSGSSASGELLTKAPVARGGGDESWRRSPLIFPVGVLKLNEVLCENVRLEAALTRTRFETTGAANAAPAETRVAAPQTAAEGMVCGRDFTGLAFSEKRS